MIVTSPRIGYHAAQDILKCQIELVPTPELKANLQRVLEELYLTYLSDQSCQKDIHFRSVQQRRRDTFVNRKERKKARRIRREIARLDVEAYYEDLHFRYEVSDHFDDEASMSLDDWYAEFQQQDAERQDEEDLRYAYLDDDYRYGYDEVFL